MRNSKTFTTLSTLLLVGSMSISHAQTCNQNLPRTAPDSRYQEVAGSDGTEVLDLHTQLIWQRCSVGQQWNGVACTGTATKHVWVDALAEAKAVGADYRLPNIKELQSLIEEACSNGAAINDKFFPQTPNDATSFWSSSPYSSRDNISWLVSFDSGRSSYTPKSISSYVRAVRTGHQQR